jgi:RND family efflux transporter MFP subunit
MKRRACLLLLIAALGCRNQEPMTSEAAEPEPRPESFTNWTTKTELFVEYPPLIVGQTSRFAIHLTRLDTFKPIGQGRVEVRLAPATGTTEIFATDTPSRPGIFGVNVEPSHSGEYRVSIHLEGEGISDVHDLGQVGSSATTAEAIHEHGPQTVETIAFLKEQQWTLDFATAIVEERQLRSSLWAPAEVIPRSGGEAEVTVPFDGRLVAENLPILGSAVKKGQLLASVLPPASSPSDLASLELARDEASLAIQLARRDRERAERLVTSGAAPAKRLDESRTAEAMAEARLKTAEVRLAQYEASSVADGNPGGAKPFALRAPISGVIVVADAAPGANVKAGETLFKIVDLDTVYVSAIVPEAELPQVRRLSGAEMEIPGTEQPRRLQRLVSVGRVVDPASRTFPVIYEVDNRDRRIAINQAVHVRLFTETTSTAPVVAESAVVDDGGRPVIFIHLSGEAFVRRPVKLGIREGGFVQVLEGAWPGERVVTKGAHLIRLSAMSSQVPAHGHVH